MGIFWDLIQQDELQKQEKKPTAWKTALNN